MTTRLTSREWKIIIAIAAISLIQGLQYGVSPVLNAISEHYPTVSVSLVQMLITAPSILAMFVGLVSGYLVTRISKKRMLLFAAVLSAVTGLVPFVADSFALLFLMRTVYGVGLGIATALNSAVVSEFFQGDKRVKVMGIQGATVGMGMVIVTSVSGMLGANQFELSYWINLLGLLSLVLIGVFLPDTGVVTVTSEETIHLNGHVAITALFGFVEFMLLITFTTNIAMHLATNYENSTGLSGIITGIFSAAQIVIGLLLGAVAKVTKRLTLTVAMFSFALGCVLLVLFPQSVVMLALGAVLCGFSQGIFIPTAYVEAANAVNAASASMSAAVMTCATCSGQIVSSPVLNRLAQAVFGETTPRGIYMLAMVGMVIGGVLCGIWQICSHRDDVTRA